MFFSWILLTENKDGKGFPNENMQSKVIWSKSDFFHSQYQNAPMFSLLCSRKSGANKVRNGGQTGRCVSPRPVCLCKQVVHRPICCPLSLPSSCSHLLVALISQVLSGKTSFWQEILLQGIFPVPSYLVVESEVPHWLFGAKKKQDEGAVPEELNCSLFQERGTGSREGDGL